MSFLFALSGREANERGFIFLNFLGHLGRKKIPFLDPERLNTMVIYGHAWRQWSSSRKYNTIGGVRQKFVCRNK